VDRTGLEPVTSRV